MTDGLRSFPDAAHAAAEHVAPYVHDGTPVVWAYEPGDMTCYEILICPPPVRPGGTPGPTVSPGERVVAVVNFGTVYAFDFDRSKVGPFHGDYVGEKLGLARGSSRTDMHTGAVVAEFLNAIVDWIDRWR